MSDGRDYAEAVTIGDLLVRAADRYGDEEALVFPNTRCSYRRLLLEAERVAAALHAMGVRRGDRVGLLMPNCPEFVHAFFGASMLGAVVVPVNARFKRRELRFVIENADLKVLFTSDVVVEHTDYVAQLSGCFPELEQTKDPERLDLAGAPSLRSIVLFGERRPAGFLHESRLTELAEQTEAGTVADARARVRIRDVAIMPYTSGTTAQPKGCLLTHEALVRQWLVGGKILDVRRGDHFWNPMPMFHLSGLGPLLFAIDAGAILVCMTHFEPGAALEQIALERATHLFPLFPPLVMGLLRHPSYATSLLQHVRVVGHSAPPETLRLAAGLLPDGAHQVSFYGLTECCGTLASSRPGQLSNAGIAVVRPHQGIEVRIVDPETSSELPADEPGEIHVRGYCVFEGYHKEPELTARTLDPDGWVRTGDLGLLDQQGWLTYMGRLKEMLKVGGENVAPAEIESLLSTHPAVQVAQVVGRPDEHHGEVPVAFVETVAGHSVTAEDLIGYCRGELASWKIPREVRFVKQWPTSATKIQKNRLREMLDEPREEGSTC